MWTWAWSQGSNGRLPKAEREEGDLGRRVQEKDLTGHSSQLGVEKASGRGRCLPFSRVQACAVPGCDAAVTGRKEEAEHVLK